MNIKAKKRILPWRKVVWAPALLFLFFCSCHPRQGNQLADANSPYLKAHADDPVDWHEWGGKTLQLAKAADKPLLISIGYSACHWCHVMEKETFTDTSVARFMNENFVCIKVDREERPDIDNFYTNACQLISGGSGWPLNAFALPDGKPFFAGTYYSKGSWLNLLKQIASAYKNQNNKVVLQAQALASGITKLEFSIATGDSDRVFTKVNYKNIFDSLYQRLDLTNGGFRGTPKFPSANATEFLLQDYFLTRNQNSLEAAKTSLTKMALGGLFDHVGGGFSRYAVDSSWRIPHFEKMLCDNGQLLSLYAHAYQLTGNDFFKGVGKGILAFVQKDLSGPNGGYYSSTDADTKEGEGEFYSWSLEEFEKIVGTDCQFLADYFNLSDKGNWKTNRNVLFASVTPNEFSVQNRIAPGDFQHCLVAGEEKLRRVRDKRERPSVDGKILTSWNALLLKGFLDAYAAYGDSTCLQKALENARFLEKNMLRENGSLWRYLVNGKVSVDAFLEDYAYLGEAFMRLYQLTFDKHWLLRSKQLAERAINNFYDPGSGMFFSTASQSNDFSVRKIEITDRSLPSPNAVMAKLLYSLGVYFQNDDYVSKSSFMLSRMNKELVSGAPYFASWYLLLGLQSFGSNEVVIMGREALSKNLELQKNFLPVSIFMGSTGEEELPLMEAKRSGNRTIIYVCTNKVCKMPVEKTTDALGQINALPNALPN